MSCYCALQEIGSSFSEEHVPDQDQLDQDQALDLTQCYHSHLEVQLELGPMLYIETWHQSQAAEGWIEGCLAIGGMAVEEEEV